MKIFNYFSEKWVDKKAKVKFKNFDVTNWERNNCNRHIAQYLKK